MMPLTGGTPTLIAAVGQAWTGAFVLDPPFLYWVNRSAGTVAKTFDAGGPLVGLGSGLDQPTSIAADSVKVYVTTYTGVVVSIPIAGGAPTVHSSGLRVPHTIMRMAPGGGTPEVFDNGQNPEVLVFGGDALYWLSYTVNGFIRKVPLDGSARTVIASGISLGKSLAATENCVYWVTADGAVRHVKR
jgi:hypothetical protein